MTYNTVTDRNGVRSAGQAFGEFQMDLADFDITQLNETIPGFHDTRQRYEQLRASIREDRAGRGSHVGPESDYLLAVQEQACRLTDQQRAGELPLRVTQNDT